MGFGLTLSQQWLKAYLKVNGIFCFVYYLVYFLQLIHMTQVKKTTFDMIHYSLFILQSPNETQNENDEEENQDVEAVQAECLEFFSQRDFIMEANMLSVLKRYYQHKLSSLSTQTRLFASFIEIFFHMH